MAMTNALIQRKRFRRRSRAFHTSPMPPAPSFSRSMYEPIFCSAVGTLIPRYRRVASASLVGSRQPLQQYTPSLNASGGTDPRRSGEQFYSQSGGEQYPFEFWIARGHVGLGCFVVNQYAYGQAGRFLGILHQLGHPQEGLAELRLSSAPGPFINHP
jgi:hypothetical protein